MERRFIEEHFPIKEISNESSKEKSVRHGHLSTMHVWWARRPLAASRATIFASLIPTTDDFSKKKEFIVKLSKWNNSTNKEILKKAKNEILEFHEGKIPKVLDPFAGGGSIPLESLKLGCETYASDYNPVAYILLKCTLELIQKFSEKTVQKLKSTSSNHFLDEFLLYQKKIIDSTKNELEKFFPEEKGEVKVGYLWTHYISCQNPSCKKKFPLMKQFWLDKKSKISLFPIKSDKTIKFKIINLEKDPHERSFNPSKGTISDKAIATCPFCEYPHTSKNLHDIFQKEKIVEEIICVVTRKKNSKKKDFRIATKQDFDDYQNSCILLSKKNSQLLKKWGLSPIPDEPTPLSNGSGAERAFNLRNYNLDTWGKLFNQRQLLVAISFIEKLRDLSEISKKPHEEEKIAITIYLAILINKIITYNNKLCRWESDGGFIAQPFARSSLSIIYDYFEANPFSESSGSWESALDWLNLCLLHIMQSVDDQGIISKNSSTDLPYSDNFFDGVFTDPPYYDNYPYSYLSDFFYVWLKRSIGHLYPELFVTPLTPKSNEIVLYGNKPGGWDEGKIFFETMLGKSFSEIFRVLKPNGISVIVYAHKSTEGWETLIKSILNSGLTVTAAWPIHTERKARPRSNRSASLASSIYMVCRKWKKEPIGFYKDVKKELKNYLDKKLEQLWNEGISGADFFVSAIGAAIEVFGKYTKVVDDTDNIIPVIRLLNDTREIVTNYAIRQVLHSEFSDEISKMTRFYILWRWAYGEARVTFDNALRMSQSTGIDIEYEWNKGFIVKESENIRVLGPEERDLEELQKSHELIDTLHLALILWKNKKKDSLDKLLKEKGYDKSDMFRRVGQAISESLPQENTEKKWLDGFLTGFRQNDSQSGTQTKLF